MNSFYTVKVYGVSDGARDASFESVSDATDYAKTQIDAGKCVRVDRVFKTRSGMARKKVFFQRPGGEVE